MNDQPLSAAERPLMPGEMRSVELWSATGELLEKSVHIVGHQFREATIASNAIQTGLPWEPTSSSVGDEQLREPDVIGGVD